MTVLIPLIVAVASGLAFAAYKNPDAYRVICIFALPVLVKGGFLVLAIKIGDLNGSIKSIYDELPNIRKYALSDQLPYQIKRLYEGGQFLKVFLIYYISGFAYLVFLLVLRDLLDLAKDRRHTPTWYGADVTGAVYRSTQAQGRFQRTVVLLNMVIGIMLIIVGFASTIVFVFASRRSKSKVVRVLFWTTLLATEGTILYSGIVNIRSDRELRLLRERIKPRHLADRTKFLTMLVRCSKRLRPLIRRQRQKPMTM